MTQEDEVVLVNCQELDNTFPTTKQIVINVLVCLYCLYCILYFCCPLSHVSPPKINFFKYSFWHFLPLLVSQH